jgi:hypothetical protein
VVVEGCLHEMIDRPPLKRFTTSDSWESSALASLRIWLRFTASPAGSLLRLPPDRTARTSGYRSEQPGSFHRRRAF